MVVFLILNKHIITLKVFKEFKSKSYVGNMLKFKTPIFTLNLAIKYK